jgi:hypothetical protein
VVGECIRARPKAWVWRCAESREAIFGRLRGRESHCGVLSRRVASWGERGGEVRREEKRRMSSTSSVGRGDLDGGFVLEALVLVVEVGGERSRLLRAVRRRWDFAARIRAAFDAYEVLELQSSSNPWKAKRQGHDYPCYHFALFLGMVVFG